MAISLEPADVGKPRLYNPQETERMHELAGRELASFTSRAVAFLIDFLIAGALFSGGLVVFSSSQTVLPASVPTTRTSRSS